MTLVPETAIDPFVTVHSVATLLAFPTMTDPLASGSSLLNSIAAAAATSAFSMSPEIATVGAAPLRSIALVTFVESG